MPTRVEEDRRWQTLSGSASRVRSHGTTRAAPENQRAFKRLKYAEIVAAASIPVVAGIDGAPLVIPAVLGALVVVVESVLHLNQYHENWLTYRSAAETLRSERVLYLARAGYYASAPDPHALLAERIVAMSSRENTKWAAQQEQEAAAAPASQTRSTP